ncbi:MAG: hypothetical protein Q8O31_08820 [Rhodocyclaceae bacterium]|nr:hypothetical protein [Rhodocyclaceae bacterium]
MRPHQGFILIFMMALLVPLALVFWLEKQDSSTLLKTRDEVTTRALQLAKEALIGYAVSYPEQHPKGTPARFAWVHGHLPCPDSLESLGFVGDEDPNCGVKGVTVIGRFPWKTLGLPRLQDGSGNDLWYAVSGSFKANPKMDILNWDSLGQFEVIHSDGSVLAGNTPESRPVAIIFSPGASLFGQNRADHHAPQNFLERAAGVNNAEPNALPEGITRVVAAGPLSSFNDRLLWISRDDLFANRIEKRASLELRLENLRQKVAGCIAVYGLSNQGNRLPWAAPITLSSVGTGGVDTWQNDRFNDVSGGLVGRIPLKVRDSFQSTGSTLPSFSGCTSTDNSSCRLFRVDNCPELLDVAGYPTPQEGTSFRDSPDGWLEKWKDHLFYAVAEDFKPTSSVAPADRCAQPTTADRKCLFVSGRGPFAAVILFAGKRQTGQVRSTLAERNQSANYLEGDNAIAMTVNSASDSRFGQFANSSDALTCIRTNLTVDMTCTMP